MAATCIESMALQTGAATKVPGVMQSAIANIGVVHAEQPELGSSSAVLLLVIKLMWLGNVYDGQSLATDREM